MKKRIPACSFVLALFFTCTLLAPAVADEDLDRSFTGWFDIGTRSTTVDGNESKFREDVNLLDGSIRLFDLSLQYKPQRGDGQSGLFESMTLDAGGLGGEPQSFARFHVRGSKARYDLKIRYRAADRFHADAGYFFRSAGDLHNLDTRRERFNIDLKLRPMQGLTLRVGMEEIDRDGLSTTTRDIQREVVVLSRPVDQNATEFYIAGDYRRGWASFSLEQRARDWSNHWNMSTAALTTYQNTEREEGDAPVTRFRFLGTPTEQVRISVGYQQMDAESSLNGSGAWSGVDFDGLNYSTVVTNTTRTEKTWDQLEADLFWLPRPQLEIGVTYDSRSWDQNGVIDYLEVQTGGTEAGTYPISGTLTDQVETDTLGLTARWQASPKLSLWASVAQEDREAAVELAGPAVTTERSLVRGGLRYRPNDTWDLKLDYETGDDDNPYTQASPTATDRIRLKVGARPWKKLRLELRFRGESRENSLAYPLGVPTDDVPPATELALAKFDTTAWALTGSWNDDRFDIAAGYHRIEVDSNADIVFVTGASFFPVFDIQTALDQTAYVAETDLFQVQGKIRFLHNFTAGVVISVLSNQGTFPTDRNRYGVDLRCDMKNGLFFRGQADRYELEEQNPYAGDPVALTPAINNYDADLLTLAIGYRF